MQRADDCGREPIPAGTQSRAGPRAARLLVGAVTVACAAALAAPGAAHARDVYVASSDDRALSIIDSATNAVQANVAAVGNAPRSIAITPSGTRAFVSNRDGNSISVVNTETKQTIQTIPIPAEGIVQPAPRGIAISPSGGRAYVANSTTHDVAVIDTQSNSIVGDIELGGLLMPQGVAVTPDGTRVLVTAEDPGANPDRVAVIDTASSTVVGQVNLPPNSSPRRVAITPDGRRAYVAMADRGNASVIDVGSLGVVAEPALLGAPDSPTGVAIAPNGGRAYIADWDKGNIWPIDTQTNQGVAPLSVGTGDPDAAILPDSSRLFVTSINSDTVPVVDLSTNATLANIAGIRGPVAVAIVPDQGPTARFDVNPGPAGSATYFDASQSSDPDGTVARFDWNFGDGSTAANGGPSPAHTYAAAGTYEVTLTATDNEGASTAQVFTGQTVSLNGSAAASTAHGVTIAAGSSGDSVPTVRIKKPKAGRSLRSRSFKQASGTATDPDGIAKVQWAIAKVKGRSRVGSGRAGAAARKCNFVNRRGKPARRARSCNVPRYFAAKGKTAWKTSLKRRLKKGKYELFARATDSKGSVSQTKKRRFSIRRR